MNEEHYVRKYCLNKLLVITEKNILTTKKKYLHRYKFSCLTQLFPTFLYSPTTYTF